MQDNASHGRWNLKFAEACAGDCQWVSRTTCEDQPHECRRNLLLASVMDAYFEDGINLIIVKRVFLGTQVMHVELWSVFSFPECVLSD